MMAQLIVYLYYSYPKKTLSFIWPYGAMVARQIPVTSELPEGFAFESQ
jgi:hypothetical protein